MARKRENRLKQNPPKRPSEVGWDSCNKHSAPLLPQDSSNEALDKSFASVVLMLQDKNSEYLEHVHTVYVNPNPIRAIGNRLQLNNIQSVFHIDLYPNWMLHWHLNDLNWRFAGLLQRFPAWWGTPLHLYIMVWGYHMYLIGLRTAINVLEQAEYTLPVSFLRHLHIYELPEEVLWLGSWRHIQIVQVPFESHS